MKIDRLDLFTTPLFVAMHPQAKRLNHELLHVLQQYRARDEGVQRSNVNAWHSKNLFVGKIEPPLVTLRTFMLSTFVSIYRALGAGRIGAKDVTVRGWANIISRGGYNALHSHAAHLFSGTYYVQCARPKHLEGQLELRDPRGAVTPIPGDPFTDRFLLSPEAGMLVVFPGWLYHMVHPHQADEDRVSIAFNLDISSYATTPKHK